MEKDKENCGQYRTLS